MFTVTARRSPSGTLSVSPVEPIIQAGDVLNGKTVASFGLWDPLSKSGIRMGLLVGFSDNNRAVVLVQ